MAKTYKTNKKHFKKYVKECKLWIKRLGLKDWDVEFKHSKDSKSLGNCNWNIIDKWAVIILAVDWGETKPTDYEIKSTAYHEVHELLLAMMYTLASYRYSFSDDQYQSERHSVIQCMLNYYFKKDYYGRKKK